MKVSIIVVAYNNVPMSQRCIKSIKANTYYPYELICVDDGSEDHTYSYFRSVTKKAYRIEHGGPAKARNEGLRHTAADLIIFLDNDVLVGPFWLWILARRSVSPDLGIIGGIPSDEKWKLSLQRSKDGLIDVQEMAGACMGIRRECFWRVGFLDESLSYCGEDTDYCFRAILAGFRVALCPEVIVRHEPHSTNRQQSMIEESRKKFYKKWQGYEHRFYSLKRAKGIQG